MPLSDLHIEAKNKMAAILQVPFSNSFYHNKNAFD